jgi:cbb3-type cytochrome oxidase subunit 1
MLLLAMAGYNLFKTVGRRREKQLYVSLWYFLGTFTWFPVIYFIGNVMWVTPFNAPPGAPWGGALTGVNDAIVNWFTPTTPWAIHHDGVGDDHRAC